MAVVVTDSVTVDASIDEVFAEVEDLTRYPAWSDLVARAEPVQEDAGAQERAWDVDLRGRVGRLARSKRLRMVRTVCDDPCRVRFIRRELDGDHAPWVLEVGLDAHGATTDVTMRFEYGGGLWGPVIERLLREGIETSKGRLAEVVSGR